ncbi:ATP-dependent Clp protease proteolytic subunit [Castellaniella hirudinis]
MDTPPEQQAATPQNVPSVRPHIIHMACPVTQTSVQVLHNVTLGAIAQGATSIDLRMSSEGGNLAAGFAAYGLLTSLPIPVHTHNNGNVESVAVLIYLAGSERTVAAHGRFVLHPLNWALGNGSVDHSRLIEWSDSLNFDRNRYCAIFQQATQGAESPIDVLQCLKNEALIIGPAAARAAGITTRAVSTDSHTLPSENIVHWWVDRF